MRAEAARPPTGEPIGLGVLPPPRLPTDAVNDNFPGGLGTARATRAMAFECAEPLAGGPNTSVFLVGSGNEAIDDQNQTIRGPPLRKNRCSQKLNGCTTPSWGLALSCMVSMALQTNSHGSTAMFRMHRDNDAGPRRQSQDNCEWEDVFASSRNLCNSKTQQASPTSNANPVHTRMRLASRGMPLLWRPLPSSLKSPRAPNPLMAR